MATGLASMGDAEKRELLILLEEKDRREKANTLDCSKMSRTQANTTYQEVLDRKDKPAQRKLCKTDLFYLLTVALKRKDTDRDWLYARCREVEADPDGYLDLWAREHYKSTIITFALTIQEIINDPEITIGIFSHTRPIAKDFLDQIRRELETNEYLRSLFYWIFYADPERSAPKWSSEALIVKRKGNPKEATVEAWGLVKGQPTGRHFKLMVYDDVVTLTSVSTPDQIKKTTNAWEISLNLGSDGGRVRYIGTRYHLYDTYAEMMERGAVKPRVHAATDDGTLEGTPVFLTKEALLIKRRDQGPYNFACQQLQNPVADKAMSFSNEWLRFYTTLGVLKRWNTYLLVDPASQKKKTSDYTVMAVIGLAPDNNYYVIDFIRDRLNLVERTKKLFELHQKYQPNAVGYERYGAQADIEHMQDVMERDNYRFDIIELGGSIPKEDRIKKLVPLFDEKRWWLPKELWYVDYEGKRDDLIQRFIKEEYSAFPVCLHDDVLDTFARIKDPVLGAKFPKALEAKTPEYSDNVGHSLGWMG